MPKRLIGMDELRPAKGISYSKSQIYRKIKAKTFPQPVRLGENRVAFLEEEIDEWIESLVSIRNGGNAA